MKKSLIVSLAAVTTFGLAACSGTTPVENVEANDSFAAESNLTAIDEAYPSNDLLLTNDTALSNDVDLNAADPLVNATGNAL